jgi:hypothetical protein
MAKAKDKRQARQLYAQIKQTAAQTAPMSDAASGHLHDIPLTAEVLASSKELAPLTILPQRRELPKMKKFRFQLLHQWLVMQRAPCRVADVGGGKGLLAYLLRQSGWSATVIDPIKQTLPTKYKDLALNKQVHLASVEDVPRINRRFAPEMAQDFDLLVAMHAHGCNIQLIDAAAQFGCEVLLLPCCVIDEPLFPPPGTHWIQWVAEYMIEKGFAVEPFRLNFKGQNIGLYARKMTP